MRHLKLALVSIITIAAVSVAYLQWKQLKPFLTKMASSEPKIEVNGYYYDEDGQKNFFQASLDRTEAEPKLEIKAKDLKSDIKATTAGCVGCGVLSHNIDITAMKLALTAITSPEELKLFVAENILKGSLDKKSSHIESGVCIDDKKKDEFAKLNKEQQKKIQSCEVKCFKKDSDSDDESEEDQIKNLQAIDWGDDEVYERVEACLRPADKFENLARKSPDEFNRIMDALEQDYREEIASKETDGEAKKLIDRMASSSQTKIKRRAQAIQSITKADALTAKYEATQVEMQALEAKLIIAEREGKPGKSATILEQMEKLNTDFLRDTRTTRAELTRMTSLRGGSNLSATSEKDVRDVLSKSDEGFKEGIASLVVDRASGALAKADGIRESRFTPASEVSLVRNNVFSQLDQRSAGQNPSGFNDPWLAQFGNQYRGDMPNGFRLPQTYNPGLSNFPTQLDLHAIIDQIWAAAQNPTQRSAPNGIPQASNIIRDSNWVTGTPNNGVDRNMAAGRTSGFNGTYQAAQTTFGNNPNSGFVAGNGNGLGTFDQGGGSRGIETK